MSSKSLLFLCIMAVLGYSCTANRCSLDRNYSYRVCSAISNFFRSRQQCDIREQQRLKQRVAFLQGVLHAVVRERKAIINRANAKKTFPTSYLVEKGFSCVVLLHTKQRNRLDISKRGDLRMFLTGFTPDVKKLALSHQAQGCSEGEEYQKNCYFLLDKGGAKSMKSHQQAEIACRTHKATLATMHSEPVYSFLYNYVKKNAQDFVKNARNLVLVWTGASYIDGQIILENNRTSNFSMWSSYHPLNDTARNKIAVAVATNPSVQGMFDALPATKLYPLCRKKLKS